MRKKFNSKNIKPPSSCVRENLTLTLHTICLSFDGQVRKVRCASLAKLFLALLAHQEIQESQAKLEWQVKVI